MQLKTVQQTFILQKNSLETDSETHMYSSQFIHV